MKIKDDPFLELAEIAKNELIPLLKSSLSACADRHQLTLDEGSDNFSFGTDAWSFPKYAFKKHLKDTKIFVSSKSGCVLVNGDFEIRHHKVGDSSSDDICSSFPKGARGICQEVKEQYAFDFLATDQAYDGNVVLAYMANPSDGLCAAYLAVPNKIERDKIEGWGKIVEIYRQEEDDLFTQNNGETLAEPENVDEPLISIVKSKKENRE